MLADGKQAAISLGALLFMVDEKGQNHNNIKNYGNAGCGRKAGVAGANGWLSACLPPRLQLNSDTVPAALKASVR